MNLRNKVYQMFIKHLEKTYSKDVNKFLKEKDIFYHSHKLNEVEDKTYITLCYYNEEGEKEFVNFNGNVEDLEELKESINETANIEQKDNVEEIDNQIQNLEQSVLNLAELLSMSSAELDYFDAKFKELEEQLKELHGKKQNISRMNKTDLIFENIDEELLQFIDKQDVNLQQYNDMLVRKIVQKVVVLQHDKIEVNFVDGKNVEVLMRNI